MALGGGILYATRDADERTAPIARSMPATATAPLPAVPPPLPARPARDAQPAPPAGVEAAAAAPARLVLTLEEQPAEGRAAPAEGEGTEEVVEYTVIRGDTLWAIARRYTDTPFRYREIASDNDLRNPHLIFPGQALTLRIRRLP